MTVKNSLRALALTAASAFRTKTITVPEWDNAKVTLREPSGESWARARELIETQPSGDDVPKISATEAFLRNKDADVIVFIDCLLDENGERVFSDEDAALVSDIYGPVHSRLLRQAMELALPMDEAEKK